MLKKYYKYLSFLLISLFCTSLAFAQQPAPTSTPLPSSPPATQQAMLIPSPPDINASAYILMDANSGKIIAQKNMDQRIAPASLTKIMTMYIVSQAIASNSIQLDSKVLISKKAWQTGGSKMFVRVGKSVPVKDLVQGIIVDSGNDACVAMSEYIAGSEDAFVNMMNAEAQRLGMNNSHFADCTGLPTKDHYSTAHDLAVLAQAIIKNYPQDYEWYKQKWFSYNGIRQPNRNRLLWRYPYADGLKTGHTDEAGYCLVSSALKDGMRLISVVVGAPTDEARANDSITLLSYGFRFFETHPIYQATSVITKARVWLGSEKTVPAGVTNDLYVTIPHGQFKNIQVNISLLPDLKAPVTKGQNIGTLTVTLNNQTVTSQPLVALKEDAKGGIFHRAVDHINHFFHSWFKSKPAKQTGSVSAQSMDTNSQMPAENNTLATPTNVAQPVQQPAQQTMQNPEQQPIQQSVQQTMQNPAQKPANGTSANP
ncbi:MAG: D-alanyl-D-alanine carboxypeptidase [Gammaproteobacteria bacterium]|nr:D-alanyl-D-alanine carboxypeptidase [Gammaproteobacteria bacterium]